METTLDLIQTRSCRILLYLGKEVRVLVPIFDFFNHNRNNNVKFVLDNTANPNFLIAHAIRNIEKKEQICITYDLALMMLAWKCLFSYRFIPKNIDDDLPKIHKDDAAKLVIINNDLSCKPDNEKEKRAVRRKFCIKTYSLAYE